MDDLTPILDEDGTDPQIDWPSCEKGLKSWIKHVNNRYGTFSLKLVLMIVLTGMDLEVQHNITEESILFYESNVFAIKLFVKISISNFAVQNKYAYE